MTGSSVAGIITAVGVVITALGGFILSIGVLIPILRNSRALRHEVKEVHTMVNQQHTDLVRRVSTLTRALTRAGVEVPEDQAAPQDPLP